MKIKRFVAADMRQALQKVREEQGPDAVILSTRTLPEGTEVVAAVDYDESLMLASTTQTAAPSAPVNVLAKEVEKPVGTLPKVTAVKTQIEIAPVLSSVIGVNDRQESVAMNAMRRELAAMRRIIEHQLGQYQEDRLRLDPVRARLLDEFLGYGIEAEHARTVVACIATDKPLERARGHALGLLAKSIEIAAHDPLDAGGVIALIGPTGAGKTTTLAKLAARYAARYSPRDVALVAADGQRIGACEQLQSYGHMLGMPVIVCNGRARLQESLQRLGDYRLLLIDCAGLAPDAAGLAHQLSWLREQRPVSRLLVLPTHLQGCDMDRMIDRFDPEGECGVVLTKLDETSQLGGAISVAIRRRLRLCFVSDGQRIPEDLKKAEAHRLVLRLGRVPDSQQIDPKQEQRHVVA
jgi:flagellar biosynthesis protein FlhF